MSERRIGKTANEAFAEAMRQINPDVVAAYPITPATEIVQIFSQFVADGKVDTEFVPVESEHSAMSAVIGASLAGARAMTATSSQGLALMWEVLNIASGLRLPIIMPMVNRSLSAPINIHCDHSDSMGARDTGWIQIFSESVQESYDNLLQAVRIAEEMFLPVMVTTDGFILSHCLELIESLSDKEVKEFIGKYQPKNFLLDIEHPITIGALDLQDYYFEHKRQEAEAMIKSKEVILKVGEEFGEKFGRNYRFFEDYKISDSEVAIVVMGSTAGTAKTVVDQLREEGIKAGLLKLRVFRPFPAKELKEVLKNVKAIAILDRSDSFNAVSGPLFSEIRNVLYDLEERPKIVDYIYGLGGRDIGLKEIRGIYQELEEIKKTNKIKTLVQYLGVRE
ncbi:MAG: pyruvate ferredoxin oxidoreductase [bacterium (Candidatus Ratteibacteria) CG_4_10_14_3_um_filter_41_18]|uniref:Pyruvate ferredoxin oxidoreductase n=3 Tax=Candidatus Ratteibacteria TaxID=2979319 RepID=A0A2M7YDY0_9BACT|nr:MAG: pyruvate ferredoxin oxidoreductase [Candidatus Omnitrophica bacterium CG1_02_41_171]PIW34065.1 MAG: pyruvate ferredoxin oxidoreductase [bacterium (Candidatus Ratteibacteria) CG15_BIG_FIL_POST_REV_8_21_14_020_41_12]PIX77113.1 MAG: pyruvate ferredoxin oxidoreductase [bacterium (Candidatus Ratteibacteria) CG_4_10_14_3_um_filter_41_18]PJA61168.1 MAG: pyruvate ferredoxin oxidoreductase [bacterium (Candidatus Ratteibacteria) CG_4_9_14_3_um_filter_41_21]HCG77000.1 pyruvate ferredoxin oxidoredu